MGYTLKKEVFASWGANSFLEELSLVEKKGKTENGRVASFS